MEAELKTKEHEVTEKEEPLFRWNARPSLGAILPLGFQHVIAAIVGVVTPAIIVAGVCGMDDSQKTTLIQAALIMSGIVTVLQAFPLFGRIGSGLPLIMGTSFAYVPVFQAVGVQFGYGAILGAQIIGGVIAIVIAVFVRPIRKLFPTVVTGSVIFAIGVSLYPTAVRYMAGGEGTPLFGSAENWLVAIITFAVVLGLSNFGKGIFKLGSLLFGIIVGVIVSIPLGMVDPSAIVTEPIFAPPAFIPFHIEFIAPACVTVGIVFIVNAVQIIGEATATTSGAMDRDPRSKELAGAISAVGITGILGSFIGAMPSSTFGQNVGIVITNKVINRFIILIAGLIFFIAGLFPKFSALLVSVPQPVIGGATIAVFAIIAMNGVRLIAQNGLTPRNASIAGISIALGLGISQVSGALAGPGMPDWATTVFGSSALVVATIMAILLNLILPKDPVTKNSQPQEKEKHDDTAKKITSSCEHSTEKREKDFAKTSQAAQDLPTYSATKGIKA